MMGLRQRLADCSIMVSSPAVEGSLTTCQCHSTGRVRTAFMLTWYADSWTEARQAVHTCRDHGRGECPPRAPQECRWQSPQAAEGEPGCMKNMQLPVVLPYMQPAYATINVASRYRQLTYRKTLVLMLTVHQHADMAADNHPQSEVLVCCARILKLSMIECVVH